MRKACKRKTPTKTRESVGAAFRKRAERRLALSKKATAKLKTRAKRIQTALKKRATTERRLTRQTTLTDDDVGAIVARARNAALVSARVQAVRRRLTKSSAPADEPDE